MDRTELNLWTAMDNKHCKRKAVDADSWRPSSLTNDQVLSQRQFWRNWVGPSSQM